MDLFQIKGTKSIPIEVAELDKISQAFQQAMRLSYDIFGVDAFRKTANVNVKKINKPLFEIISVCFAQLNLLEREKLLYQQNDFKNAFVELQKDGIFWNAITTSTASKDSVKKRHELFRELINRFIR